MILRQIISMATCAYTTIFLQFFGVSIVVNCLLCHLTLIISHEDEIIFVLQLVEWIVYFIISVCGMYEVMFAYLLSFSFFHICLCHLLMGNISFFPLLFLHFLRKFRVNYLDELYTDISFIIVSYFVYTFYYTHVLLFHEIFSVFQLTFFAVIIMSICTHSHGSAKHWWHSSWSIVWYMLTSTKISFVETLCSYLVVSW